MRRECRHTMAHTVYHTDTLNGGGMALLRLVNGSDILVKGSLQEASAQIRNASGDGFVEFAGEEGVVMVRPSTVVAMFDSSDRRATGFRPFSGRSTSPSQRVEE